MNKINSKQISPTTVKSNFFFTRKTFFRNYPAIIAIFIAFVFVSMTVIFQKFLHFGYPFDKDLYINDQNLIYESISISTTLFLFMISVFAVPAAIITLRRNRVYERLAIMRKSWTSFTILSIVSYWIIINILTLSYMLFTIMSWLIMVGFKVNYLLFIWFIVKETIFVILFSIFMATLAFGLGSLFNGSWFTLLISFLVFQLSFFMTQYCFYTYENTTFWFIANDDKTLKILDSIFYLINPLILMLRSISTFSIKIQWFELIIAILDLTLYSFLITFGIIKMWHY